MDTAQKLRNEIKIQNYLFLAAPSVIFLFYTFGLRAYLFCVYGILGSWIFDDEFARFAYHTPDFLYFLAALQTSKNVAVSLGVDPEFSILDKNMEVSIRSGYRTGSSGDYGNEL